MNTNKIREALNKVSECINIAFYTPGALTREEWDAYNRLAKEALAELDKAPLVLTDEEVERIAYDRYLKRYYNGDREWQQRLADAMSHGLRYARDNGYLAPSAGLTVDEAEECLVEHLAQYGPDWSAPARNRLRARLTAAIEAKTNNNEKVHS